MLMPFIILRVYCSVTCKNTHQVWFEKMWTRGEITVLPSKGEVMVKIRKVLLPVLVVLTFLMIGIAISIVMSKYALSVSEYKLECVGIEEPIRIVQLSDLHNSEFGDGNSRLIDQVRSQEPDLILLTGDLVIQSEDRHEIATHLISELSKIAPVYVSLGNHELEYQTKYGVDIVKIYSDAGATVFEKSYLDLEVNGQSIRLGGIYGYCLPEKYVGTRADRQADCDFLHDFQNTDRYTILLAHNPTCWLLNGSLDAWAVDCIFSGHTHGGQIIIPYFGGVYAPDLGFFPGKLEGLYRSKDDRKTLVLSRGLGASTSVPRLNNIPDIVVVDIVPGDTP